MTKKGCCCKEENPFVKHYVAIKCDEYATKQYKTVGVHTIFDDYPPSNFTTGLGEPHFPFKVTGLAGSGLQIAKDGSRRIKLMLRGAGGGAPRESYGGNGAYIDFNLVPFSTNTMSSMSLYVGRGGPGGIHTDFSTTTINPFGGGGGFPLAGWGGGAVAYGDSVQALQAGGQYVVGSGAGAGAHIDFDTLFGGHGGVDTGIPGDGPSPGNAAIQTQGGAGGAGAGIGFARVGGYGFRFTPPGTIPVQSVGGGGGAGYFGGGGGGPSSSGGGGSSTKFDILSNKPIDQGFYGTGIGPGSRCNPFFERTTKDSGIGANNLGRYLKALGTGYVSYFNGQPGQAAEYHRTRWCPCTESQSSNDATGVFPNGPNYICLTEDQYNLILSQTANLPDYNELFNAGATDVKLSFVLNGQRYLLTTWDNDIYGDPLDNYYCTLGCEAPYMANGTFSSVKWFVPTTDVFANYSDSRNFFQTLYENAGIDLSTVTTCCDIFIGERICAPPNFNCANTTDGSGTQQGCYCTTTQVPPKYKAVCRSAVSVDEPFIAVDQESQFYYLCIPASGWRRFGNDAINTLYNFFNGVDPENQIDFANTLSFFSFPSSLDIGVLEQELCNDSGQYNNVTVICNSGAGGGDECGCLAVFANDYVYQDPEGINGFMTFTHYGAKMCAHDLYKLGQASCCGFCPEETAFEMDYGPITFSFNACTQPTICQINGCYNPIQQGCGQQCQDQSCTVCGVPVTFTSLFGSIKKSLSSVSKIIANNLYRAGPWLMDSKTSGITFAPIGLGGGGDPCNDIQTGCFGGNFSGLRIDVQRSACFPTDAARAVCCSECGCKKEECEVGYRCGYNDVIIEHKSFKTQLCATITQANNEYYEKIAMEVVLNPCLFAGMDPVSALLKATSLIELTSTSYTRKICTEEVPVTGYRIKVCRQCVDLVGAPISAAATTIFLCTAPFVTGTYVYDDTGWYGERVMTCSSNCCGCLPYKTRPGDVLTLEIQPAGNTFKGVFRLKSPKYKCCVRVKAEPLCDLTLGSDGDCYTFQNGGIGKIDVEFISNESISYPEWANGSRWSFSQTNESNTCDPQNPPQSYPPTCVAYKCSQCRIIDNPLYPEGKCCSLRSSCNDNSKKCTEVPDIFEYCDLCQPFTCCNQDVNPDCEIQGLSSQFNACGNDCLEPPYGPEQPQFQPCPYGSGCQVSKSPQEQDKPCTTQVGGLIVF